MPVGMWRPLRGDCMRMHGSRVREDACILPRGKHTPACGTPTLGGSAACGWHSGRVHVGRADALVMEAAAVGQTMSRSGGYLRGRGNVRRPDKQQQQRRPDKQQQQRRHEDVQHPQPPEGQSPQPEAADEGAHETIPQASSSGVAGVGSPSSSSSSSPSFAQAAAGPFSIHPSLATSSPPPSPPATYASPDSSASASSSTSVFSTPASPVPASVHLHDLVQAARDSSPIAASARPLDPVQAASGSSSVAAPADLQELVQAAREADETEFGFDFSAALLPAAVGGMGGNIGGDIGAQWREIADALRRRDRRSLVAGRPRQEQASQHRRHAHRHADSRGAGEATTRPAAAPSMAAAAAAIAMIAPAAPAHATVGAAAGAAPGSVVGREQAPDTVRTAAGAAPGSFNGRVRAPDAVPTGAATGGKGMRQRRQRLGDESNTIFVKVRPICVQLCLVTNHERTGRHAACLYCVCVGGKRLI